MAQRQHPTISLHGTDTQIEWSLKNVHAHGTTRPKPVTLDSEFGTFSMSCDATSSGLRTRVHLQLGSATISVQAYPAYRRWLSQIEDGSVRPSRYNAVKISSSLVSLCLIAVLASACSQPRRATLKDVVSNLPKPTSPQSWAELGWWSYLAEDIVKARHAFVRSGLHPLGQLGRLQLAWDAMDMTRIKAIGLKLHQRPDEIGTLVRYWMRQADVEPKATDVDIPSNCISSIVETPTPVDPRPSERNQTETVGTQIIAGTQRYDATPGIGSQGPMNRVVLTHCSTQKETYTMAVELNGTAVVWSNAQPIVIQPKSGVPASFR